MTVPHDFNHSITEVAICPECAGYGFHFCDTGPSGATLDCQHCDGEGGWPVAEHDLVNLNAQNEREAA